MESALTIVESPAAVAAIAAAFLWASAMGHPPWPAAARGRFASTLAISASVGLFVFLLIRRAAALAAG